MFFRLAFKFESVDKINLKQKKHCKLFLVYNSYNFLFQII